MLDLFSGIGGFSLAAQWCWGDELEIVSFVEKDKFCQKVLNKHWSNVPIIEDIKDYKYDGSNINLLTGGFPCQPFSVAGKRKSKEDDRYLWPEMFRVITETRPDFCIIENVTGIIHLALDQVLSDLESENFQTQTFIIPACAVNAPHRRDRIWIVAYSGLYTKRCENKSEQSSNNFAGFNKEIIANTADNGCNSGGTLGRSRQNKTIEKWTVKTNKQIGKRRFIESCKVTDAPDTTGEGLNEGHVNQERQTARYTMCFSEFPTQSPVCGGNDGTAVTLDGFELSASRHRIERLKALGNAIVPQVAYQIMCAIKGIV